MIHHLVFKAFSHSLGYCLKGGDQAPGLLELSRVAEAVKSQRFLPSRWGQALPCKRHKQREAVWNECRSILGEQGLWMLGSRRGEVGSRASSSVAAELQGQAVTENPTASERECRYLALPGQKGQGHFSDHLISVLESLQSAPHGFPVTAHVSVCLRGYS